MRRIVMWALSTVTTVVLLFGYHTSTSGPSSASEQVISGAADATAGSSASPGSTGSTSASGSSSGTVTGSVANTRWGPVQVRISTSGGQITAVDVVQYPNGNPKDQEINAYALPVLVQETLSAQGADIDMVSGATVTSDGYIQSLQAALDEAGL